jgi:hypothetical protein
MMKRLCTLLAFVALGGSALGQAPTDARPQPGASVSMVILRSDQLLFRQHRVRGFYGVRRENEGPHVYKMSATVTNTGSRTIESVRLAFVFSDPATGEEWFRYQVHSKKRLGPGENRELTKAATAKTAVKGVLREEAAVKNAVITEIKYSDGSVWRPEKAAP